VGVGCAAGGLPGLSGFFFFFFLESKIILLKVA